MQHPVYFVFDEQSMQAYIACYPRPIHNVTRWSSRWAVCRRQGNIVELLAQGSDEIWFMKAADAARRTERCAVQRLRMLLWA